MKATLLHLQGTTQLVGPSGDMVRIASTQEAGVNAPTKMTVDLPNRVVWVTTKTGRLVLVPFENLKSADVEREDAKGK